MEVTAGAYITGAVEKLAVGAAADMMGIAAVADMAEGTRLS
eukprot:CAMPEP_0183384032 /NCGR_PEP_ID=MMETSP0370-20130417/203_1 /TAXON_ID=268820 /ORGANISM="Peridinium aciculiferum, Strain PAER-2" /LENGTH=40 /DNA_ID= /DNA_START= /DNA_END= /DNA_ORIENTATION=